MPTLNTSADVRVLGERIQRIVLAAAYRGLEQTAVLGVKHAKRLAPVRNVSYSTQGGNFSGRQAVTRFLSRAEIRSGIRKNRDQPKLRTTVRRRQQQLEAPEIKEGRTGYQLKNRENSGLINGRGRFELRRGERPGGAIYRQPTTETRTVPTRNERGQATTRTYVHRGEKVTLGGRLRGEIRSHPVAGAESNKMRIDIISPTAYARYVEFPTTRTAAQPYMRPTLAYLKPKLIQKMQSSLERL